jgi:hypothetical protein
MVEQQFIIPSFQSRLANLLVSILKDKTIQQWEDGLGNFSIKGH